MHAAIKSVIILLSTTANVREKVLTKGKRKCIQHIKRSSTNIRVKIHYKERHSILI